MTTAGAGDQQTLGRILFYRQLEPLSLEKHRKLGVSQVANPFSFLADTHLVPLTVDEFGLAAVCYPIIFDTQTKTPLAVMGLRPGMNVFLAADGTLDPEVYLPAFARRYPFLPIIAPEGQAQQARPTAQDGDRRLLSAPSTDNNVSICDVRSSTCRQQNAHARCIRCIQGDLALASAAGAGCSRSRAPGSGSVDGGDEAIPDGERAFGFGEALRVDQAGVGEVDQCHCDAAPLLAQ